MKKPSAVVTTNQQKESNYVLNEFLQSDYTKNIAFEGDKIVHLDLKGAPPKVSYYGQLFPLLAKLGATGILIEYEDMFPYSGKDIGRINKLAKHNNLKVIPLIQTFGHMEFLLKLSEYKEYREVPSYPQVICPTHENTLRLIESMVQQIISAHPEIDMIHIGADEVYYLGICDRCTETMIKYNLSKNLLFLEHINNIIEFVNKRYPHLKVLMWDD
ncbi:hypothetical protein NQ318_004504 [Aromia moschata]|uniref:beta-N-acetylhexosaminidase n=1 Tax=Aromia moschata TaxID=1265417 RepID=A0AAV8X840_9CUCU|nr:hypothetical protein NQ318_004504 [Aromia moschata]